MQNGNRKLAVTKLRNQSLERQRISSNHTTQSIHEQIGTLSPVETEAHFVQVGLQMLSADLVPCPGDAPLEQRECRFDAIRVDVSSIADVFSCTVVYGFMLEIADGFRVSAEIIGHDHINVLRDILLNVSRQSSRLGIFGMEESKFTVALANTNDAFLVVSPTHPLASVLDSAHIGFVHFDSTIQHAAVCLSHSSTNAMEQIPRRFVGALVLAPEGTLELHGAHTLASFHQEQHGHKPDRQWQVRIVEDRTRHYRELVTAFATGKLFTGLNPPYVTIAAARTLNAFGPAEFGQDFAAIFVSGERAIQFRKSHGSTS